MVAVEITARRICGSEGMEILIESQRSRGARQIVIGSVVLRDRLHRPFQIMAGNIFHRGMKADSRRIRIQSNRTYKLDSSLRIGWPRKLDLTPLSFRKFSKGEGTVVNHIGI